MGGGKKRCVVRGRIARIEARCADARQMVKATTDHKIVTFFYLQTSSFFQLLLLLFTTSEIYFNNFLKLVAALVTEMNTSFVSVTEMYINFFALYT